MFNPNIITKLITTALVIPMGFAGVEPAQASGRLCHYESGYQFCATPTGLRDVLTVVGNGDDETFKIQCRDGYVVRYESYGNLSQSDADAVANGYCEGRIDTAH